MSSRGRWDPVVGAGVNCWGEQWLCYPVAHGRMYIRLHCRFEHVSRVASGFTWEGADEGVDMDCVRRPGCECV